MIAALLCDVGCTIFWSVHLNKMHRQRMNESARLYLPLPRDFAILILVDVKVSNCINYYHAIKTVKVQ
jgi:hypothetical protein